MWATAERVSFRFAPALRTGDIVLDAKGLGAERGGRVLFEGLDLLVRRGERIGIVGPNGSGKTTLLKLLAGARCPWRPRRHQARHQPAGGLLRPAPRRRRHHALTAVDNVRQVRGDFTVEAARQYLARFRFWGDDPLRVVSGFSGGERSRLALAKLLLEPRNLLFLDEPTNHLDIPAAEILEEALTTFDGTVLLVSHDRRFLENVTTRVVSVRDGKAEAYPGGFKDYERFGMGPRAGRSPSAAPALKKEAKQAKEPKQGKDAKDPAVTKFEEQRLAARAAEKKKRRIQELETAIATGERDRDVLRSKLKSAPGDADGNGWEKLAKMAQEEQALTRKIDTMLVEWARLSEEVS